MAQPLTLSQSRGPSRRSSPTRGLGLSRSQRLAAGSLLSSEIEK